MVIRTIQMSSSRPPALASPAPAEGGVAVGSTAFADPWAVAARRSEISPNIASVCFQFVAGYVCLMLIGVVIVVLCVIPVYYYVFTCVLLLIA